jgi:hypothetical protein
MTASLDPARSSDAAEASAATPIRPEARTAPANTYDALVDTSPQGIMFCHTWWLDAVAPGQYRILEVRKGDAIKAAWPIVLRDDPAGPQVVMPGLTQKLGVLFAPMDAKYVERLSTEHQLIDQLLAQLPPGCGFEQQFHEHFTNWLPFHWAGCNQTTRYTYVFEDLSDVSALWNGLRTNCRRVIRKAQAEQIRVRETDDLEYIYRINVKTFERQGLKIPFTLDLVERIDRAVLQHAGRKAFVGEDSAGRGHACEYLIFDDQCAISLLRGADTELRASGACALVQWHAIEFATTVSRRFDFEGSMMRGVEAYIREFGATQVPYFRIWKHPAAAAPRPLSAPAKLRDLASRALRKAARLIEPTR